MQARQAVLRIIAIESRAVCGLAPEGLCRVSHTYVLFMWRLALNLCTFRVLPACAPPVRRGWRFREHGAGVGPKAARESLWVRQKRTVVVLGPTGIGKS